MLKQGKNKSPSGKASEGSKFGGSGSQGRHQPALRQGKAGTTFWWNEPKPKGGKVDNDGANERSGQVGTMPPTIGPRVA
jgi:hypothetical protein